MTNLATFRVHIAQIGFEIDRIVIPLKQTKADKLWILAHDNRSEDLSAPYLEKIKKECKKLDVEVKVAYSNRLSIFKTIKSIKDIISQEENNYIYVNVASGSKLQAIAAMMACSLSKSSDNLQPFYPEAERYAAFEGKQQSFGVKDTIPLPLYAIHTPHPKLLAALKIISEQPSQKIRKKEMARIAEEQEIITVNAEKENHSQARYASLESNIIAPLEKEWKFVEVEKIGRNRWIKITQEGIDAAEFLI